ncbi:MAG: hypothetical protein ACJAZ3_001947 [Sphingobacteriales bacterium]|jgi:hypothetical protein
MKIKYLLIALLLGSIQFELFSQCNHGISTNPNAPVNDQFIFHLPQNPFLNKFDWMYVDPLFPANFVDVQINPLAGFASGFSNTFIAPYSDQNPSEYWYLHSSPFLELRDGYSKDGWELISMNTGYYPDKTPISEDVPNLLLGHHTSNPQLKYKMSDKWSGTLASRRPKTRRLHYGE